MAFKSFKVIIAGCSIAGLSLALMLEKNGMDFLVLEAYPSIAPQVGASIGLLPNGLRNLDQLGCYMRRLWRWLITHRIRSSFVILVEDHSCPLRTITSIRLDVIFFDHLMIEILYKFQVKDEGQSYMGDIVDGADGFHSTVHKQMWEEAREKEPS
ncbi:hypothetical protein ETB97_003601 [Aspergillus alliaceus]|uniref:FAD-binding domain-containing protein n=1 Tax=Petromyces alliaceus TaxID=209559 RepID=A0A8H6A1H5_PETAA|nr:hypothetical protein ETB97_003601 [Aspergillus burnettii]